MFEKLHKFVGASVEQLVHRPDAPHVFRLHKKVSRSADLRLVKPTLRRRLTSDAVATRAADLTCECACSTCSMCGKTS